MACSLVLRHPLSVRAGRGECKPKHSTLRNETVKLIDWLKIKIANKTGRVARLSNGRVFYARKRGEATADLTRGRNG